MNKELKKSSLDKAFYISLVLKAVDSTLEIMGGIFVLLVSQGSINNITWALTEHELSKDPNDFIANHILRISHDFMHSGRYFAAFYLLSHGIVKIVIIGALFMKKLWAYPAMIMVLSAFIVYQLYRLTYRFSIGLIILTLFDAFVIWLTWREYKKHRHHFEPKTEPSD